MTGSGSDIVSWDSRSTHLSDGCVCVRVSVTSLTATPLTYRDKVRYERNANALLKVFDLWISLKYFVQKIRRYLLTPTNFDGFDGK